jgi:hypothetical protein
MKRIAYQTLQSYKHVAMPLHIPLVVLLGVMVVHHHHIEEQHLAELLCWHKYKIPDFSRRKKAYEEA